MLAPVLEAALVVARSDEMATPVRRAPLALRPLLRFTRLSNAAREQVRKALDDTDGFRERVVEVLREAGTLDAATGTLGEAVVLWLERPSGWQERLAALVEADPSESAANRRSESSESPEVPAPPAAGRGSAKAARQAQRTEATFAQAQEALREARAERAAARDERRQAGRELRALEQERVALGEALAAALARGDVAEAALEELRALLGAQVAATKTARRESEAMRRRVAGAEASQEKELQRRTAELRGALGRAATLAGELHEVLARTVEAQAFELAMAEGSPSAGQGPQRGHASSGPEGVGPRRRTGRSSRRAMRAVPGVDEFSRETASAWLTAAAVRVLVDGYNVAHVLAQTGSRAGSRVEPARLRGSLAALIGPWLSRVAVDLLVVFDGAQDVDQPASGREAVPVVYSRGRSADDEIVELAAATPARRPVVVVTADQELASRVAAHGANVVSPVRFLELLRLR